jgi:aminoglycoside/choline kinase family phosphotransferase
LQVLQRVTETGISAQNTAKDSRLVALKDWLNGIDSVAGAEPLPASEDASFRRYFRLRAHENSFIAMDAPPAQEDSKPFLRIAGYLESMNLNAPRIIEANLEQGFLLLSDLGSTQYLEKLSTEPRVAARLYSDALRALVQMQSRGSAYQSLLPPYDDKLLHFELSLFHDWLCEKHLGLAFSEEDEDEWQRLCRLLVNSALDQPQVFVHRDYHSRNLMVTEQHNPGILDFQDAVEGPLTYDVVSLLKDCYVKWPEQQISVWLCEFYDGMEPSMQARVDRDQMQRYFDLMGVQRHLKASGIFARLNHRDGKPGFMADVPRTLSYIVELEPRYEELGFLVRWINERCLPGLGASP